MSLAGRRVAAKELHSLAICFLTKSLEHLMLNQTPKNRKEEVIEIGVTDIEEILFKEDKDKLKSTGEILEVVVRGKELEIKTYLWWLAEVLFNA